ncbi:MAG: tetratricopeptide repeat protein [Myxococcota bacterium]
MGTGLEAEVYSTALLLVLLALSQFVSARPQPLPLGLLLGLSFGSHISAAASVSLLFAIFLWVRSVRRSALAASLTLAFLGMLVVAYLPLASLRDTPLDWGDPETLGRLLDHLTAGRIRDAYAQEIGHGSTGAAWLLCQQLGELVFFVLIGALGAFRMPRNGSVMLMLCVLLFATDVAYALVINPMGVVDRQVGHLAGAMICVAAGLGAARSLYVFRFKRTPAATGFARASLLGFVIWSLVSMPAFQGEAYSELYGSGGVLLDVPERSVVLCESDLACSALFFATHVEGVRPDVAVIPVQHLWEPSIRRLVSGLSWPRQMDALRPEEPAERARLVALAARWISRDLTRPVLWQTEGALKQARMVDRARLSGIHSFLCVDPSCPDDVLPEISGRSAVRALDHALRIRDRRLPPMAKAGWSRCYETVGQVRLRHRDLEAAQLALSRSVQVDPTRAAGWTNLGVVYARRGDLLRAIETTQQAISMEPKRRVAWRNLLTYARAYAGSGSNLVRTFEIEAQNAGVALTDI